MNSQYKIILLLAMMLQSVCLCLASRNNLIDENRIWVYTQRGTSNAIFKMGFDGTKDIDGKTYHILKTFYSETFGFAPRLGKIYGERETHQEFYIREENGKYYAYRFNKWYEENMPVSFDTKFDWNAEQDEIEITFPITPDAETDFIAHDINGNEVTLSLVRSYKVTIQDEVCNYYLYKKYQDPDNTGYNCYISYIEGIGFFNGSFLPAILNPSEKAAYGISPQALPSCYHNLVFLEKVTDRDGNTIFDPKTDEVYSTGQQ